MKKPTSDDDELVLFQQAMEGVTPLQNRGPAPEPSVPLPRIVSEDAEALACLAELVSGDAPFDISDGDEFIEGWAKGLDHRIVVSLKRGDYALQGHLDLHGMVQADAKRAVEAFLAKSHREGKRCVLLIHGRGLNSKDQIPVLKERLKGWLQMGRIGRLVLAFATAKPYDGGAGALYVLLRRTRPPA
jgi:DNA-nicking Smr family endonuclease